MTRRIGGPALALVLAAASPAGAQTLRLAPVFSDHMVLQRDRRVPVEGNAAPGAQVSVQLGDMPAVTGHANREGRWRLELPGHAALAATTLMIRSRGETLRLANVAVGDVFLCSGQSNMELTLRVATNADTAVAQSADPALRLFNVPRQS
ncbi:MAG TPA: 9-O-acetylesterase, partial [Sphingomonas sp.]|nr:9-O-acetylesterase [Sphingomonas sp.]